jgi:hypothetical protein
MPVFVQLCLHLERKPKNIPWNFQTKIKIFNFNHFPTNNIFFEAKNSEEKATFFNNVVDHEH